MGGPGSTEAASSDLLRRRLYAPGATEEDLAAFRAAEAAEPHETEHAPRRRPRVAVVLVAAGLVVAASTALVTLRPLAAVPVATGPTPTATGVRLPDGVILPAPQSVRAAFVQQLETRSGAGLLEYLYGHPAYLPEPLQRPTRGHVTEYAGAGPRTLALSPGRADGPAGRITVVVVVDRAARLSWRATGPDASADALTRRIDAPAGVPVTATLAYEHGAPSTLEVDVPDGASWGALVALTN